MRNKLSHMCLEKDMKIDNLQVKQYFKDLNSLVDCLQKLHPGHFTAAADIRIKLGKVSIQCIAKRLKLSGVKKELGFCLSQSQINLEHVESAFHCNLQIFLCSHKLTSCTDYSNMIHLTSGKLHCCNTAAEKCPRWDV